MTVSCSNKKSCFYLLLHLLDEQNLYNARDRSKPRNLVSDFNEHLHINQLNFLLVV